MENVIITGEQIGSSKPWVARITGLDQRFGFERDFLGGVRDYTKANSVRTRGIETSFSLEDGLYEIHLPKSWKKATREFIEIKDGQKLAIKKEEVLARITAEEKAK